MREWTLSLVAPGSPLPCPLSILARSASIITSIAHPRPDLVVIIIVLLRPFTLPRLQKAACHFDFAGAKYEVVDTLDPPPDAADAASRTPQFPSSLLDHRYHHHCVTAIILFQPRQRSSAPRSGVA